VPCPDRVNLVERYDYPYGDGVITPAISVLSAVEGLKVAAPHLQPFVLPISVAVLTQYCSFR